MKRPYTQFRSLFRDCVKLKGKELNDYLKQLAQEATADPPIKAADSALWSALISVEVEKSFTTHLFLPGKEFCDWLVSCVTSFDPKYVEVLASKLNPSDDGVTKTGCLHFPCGNGLHSIAFTTSAIVRCSKEDLPLPPYGAVVIEYSVETDPISNGYCQKAGWPLPEKPSTANYYVRLVVGIGLYLNTFPEAIRPGPPEDLKHPSHHKHKTAITVGISDKIRESCPHGSPTAHFRRGHFRVLQAECFTKKRFQTVFVREAFVLGHAKTVASLEQLDSTTP